jgi:NADH:ubiquinone oxidoreductase subunit H
LFTLTLTITYSTWAERKVATWFAQDRVGAKQELVYLVWPKPLADGEYVF